MPEDDLLRCFFDRDAERCWSPEDDLDTRLEDELRDMDFRTGESVLDEMLLSLDSCLAGDFLAVLGEEENLADGVLDRGSARNVKEAERFMGLINGDPLPSVALPLEGKDVILLTDLALAGGDL